MSIPATATDLAPEVEQNDDQANEVDLVTHICPS